MVCARYGERFYGATAAEIAQLKSDLGRDIPVDLIHWLGYFNGGQIGAHTFFGTRSGIGHADLRLAVADNLKLGRSNFLPVATDGASGVYCLACVGVDAGVMVRFLPENATEAPDYVVASDLTHFVWFLASSVDWYDNVYRGKTLKEIQSGIFHKDFFWPLERGGVLSIDPQLANIHSFQFPWADGDS